METRLKIENYQIVFQEFPGEITLALNFSSCPCHCPGCHSPQLWEDVGRPADFDYISELVRKHREITCVGLMGGDADPDYILHIAQRLVEEFGLNVGWYSGMNRTPDERFHWLTYYKIGPYIESLGGLDKPTTNQRMLYNREDGYWEDITYKFQHNQR